MINFQIKLNINDRRQIRLAFEAAERYDHPLAVALQPVSIFSREDLELVNNSLELAAQRENNWWQAYLYRETYGKISAQTHGANAQENDLNRNGAFHDFSSQTINSDRAI